ncbi:MotE family protein [Bacillus sp. FJAT-45350]|uniref:MotE family protein n=1 Tax=Bacillus sp. FJAT-45350 TaxID=2011014 RepID=UPI000BB9624C|nr:MotE family protein [Bacillus sp. FJAT-45350]
MSKEDTKEKGYGKLQWFFLIIVIPSIFAIILIYIILTILGINVFERAKEIGSQVPFLSSYLVEEEEEQINIDELYLTIEEFEAEIERLQRQLVAKEDEISDLTNQASILEEELEIEQEQTVEVQKELAEIGKTYESMSTKNAANILSELPIEEAILHISQVSTDTRAGILAKMNPELAASIMSRLANQ